MSEGTVADALGRPIVKLTDADGKTWELGAIRLGDIADLEQMLGVPMAKCGDALSTITGQLTLLWIMLRRVGLSKAQVSEARRSGKWPVAREDVDDMFSPGQAREVFEKVGEALSRVGLGGQEAVSADPTILDRSTPLAGVQAPAGSVPS